MSDAVAPDSLTWPTEQRNAASAAIDLLSTAELVDLVVTQDAFNCLNDYAVVDKRRSLWLSVNVDF